MPTIHCPLLAAGFDWIEALLPFLFVAFWIISQVFAVFRRLQGGGRQPQPPVRIDRPRGPRPAAGGGADVRSELERQIEAFLRQATGEQPRKEPPRRGESPTEPVRQNEPPRIERPVAPRPQPPRPAAAPVRKDQARTAAATRDAGRPTLQPTRGLSASSGSGAESQPAQRESVARHVQDAFAHDLTHLRGGLADDAPGSERAAARSPGLAAELAEMLRSPAATRRAILLGEVLQRPVDRW